MRVIVDSSVLIAFALSDEPLRLHSTERFQVADLLYL